MKETRKRLLIELESIVGNEFYNGNIQNWGPGGRFEGAGRELRYPVTFTDKELNKLKVRRVDPDTPSDVIITGSYRLGANELNIMRALDRVVEHLETRYGLVLK